MPEFNLVSDSGSYVGATGGRPQRECNINSAQHHSIRLHTYDYSSNGAYFLTICSYQKKSTFGEVINGRMVLSNFGEIIVQEWTKTPEIRREIELAGYVIMPNHFHAIVFINNEAGEQPLAPTPDRKGFQSRSIGSLVAGVKSSVTKRINESRNLPHQSIWQRNYYEHIIRNEAELNQIHDYIVANPARWGEDEDNPEKGIGRA